MYKKCETMYEVTDYCSLNLLLFWHCWCGHSHRRKNCLYGAPSKGDVAPELILSNKGQLTGIISYIIASVQLANFVAIHHVFIPASSVVSIMEDIIHQRTRNIIKFGYNLKGKQTIGWYSPFRSFNLIKVDLRSSQERNPPSCDHFSCHDG